METNKPLVLCQHQVNDFRYACKVGKLPPELEKLMQLYPDVYGWVHGLRCALGLASDCLQGRRLTTELMTYGRIARQVADAVLAHRGPEITEHDSYSIGLTTFDEIPEDTDGDQ